MFARARGRTGRPSDRRQSTQSRRNLMFARVVTFAGGDRPRVDEVIAAVRDRVDSGAPALADSRSFWMLVDRQKAAMLGISLFDDKETLRRGSKALEQLPTPCPDAGRKILC